MHRFQKIDPASLCSLSPNFKLLRSQIIDSKQPIPPGCVAWRAVYDNPIPSRFLAPIDCLKIPALAVRYTTNLFLLGSWPS